MSKLKLRLWVRVSKKLALNEKQQFWCHVELHPSLICLRLPKSSCNEWNLPVEGPGERSLLSKEDRLCQLAWPWPCTWEAVIYFWSPVPLGSWEADGEWGGGRVRGARRCKEKEGKQGNLPALLTQKALSWFNGCEVLPPPGPTRCWCLIRRNIQMHTHTHTTSRTQTHTSAPTFPALPATSPERRWFNPALPSQEMSYEDREASTVAPHNMFSLLPGWGL